MFCKQLNDKCQMLVPYLLRVSYAACLMLISAVFVSTASDGTIYLSCSADNDLYLALKANGIACALRGRGWGGISGFHYNWVVSHDTGGQCARIAPVV